MAKPATTRDHTPAYLLRYEARRAEPTVTTSDDGDARPAFVVRARERATRRALAELDQAAAPPGRTAAFARETVAPRELQWPEALRRKVSDSVDVRLIRHGQTQGYIADSALTALGRWQAHRKGQDLAKGMQEGSRARRRLCADGPGDGDGGRRGRRAEAGGGALRHRRRDHRRSGARRRLPELPGLDERPRAGCDWAFQEFANVLKRYERDGGGDRPGWMVEMDRVFRIQFAGGDPITYWLSTPMHYAEPPALVVRRYWEAIAEEVRAAPTGTRIFVCAHSGPIRAVAAAAVGHDPGEPNNVEDVRIRVDRDLKHATLTYRGHALQLDLPTTIIPSWSSPY